MTILLQSLALFVVIPVAVGAGQTKSSITRGNGKVITTSGVQLTFPSDWTTISLKKGEFEAVLAQLSKSPSGEQLAEMARQAARAGLYKLIVFDRKGSLPGFVNNANLVVTATPPGHTLDAELEANKQQFKSMGIISVCSKINFPAGQFGRIESELKLPNGKPVIAISYVLVQKGSAYTVSFSAPLAQSKAFDSIARRIMNSFKRA